MAGRRRDTVPTTATNAAAVRLLVEAVATEALLRAQDADYYNHTRYYASSPPPPQLRPLPPFWHFVGVLPFLRKLFLWMITGTVLLFTSLGLYGMFYKAVMPGLYVSETLHFDYTGVGKHPAVLPEAMPETRIDKAMNAKMEEKRPKATKIVDSTAFRRPRNNDEPEPETEPWILQAPWAAADLFVWHSQWEPHFLPSNDQNKDKDDDDDDVGTDDDTADDVNNCPSPTRTSDILPPPKTTKRILTRGKPHYLEVLLDLPESNHNRQIGLFGVHVQLHSSNNVTLLASSMRTSRLPHESAWVGVVRQTLRLPGLLLGALEETRRVVIPSFRYYVESSDHPLRYITVRLVAPRAARRRRRRRRQGIQQDRDDSENNESIWIDKAPEVLRGYLLVGKELTGFQEVLKEWFFTCMATGTAIFFSLQVVVVFAIQSYWEYKQEQRRLQQMTDDDASETLGRHGFDGSYEGWEDMPQNTSSNTLNGNDGDPPDDQTEGVIEEMDVPREVDTPVGSDVARNFVPFDDEDDDDEANWSSMSPLDDRPTTSSTPLVPPHPPQVGTVE